MAKIIDKKQLSTFIWEYKIEAHEISEEFKAGQFIMLILSEEGERIPFSIVNVNSNEGWIEIIFQVVGKSTSLLSELKIGDDIPNLVGPLGRPVHIEKYGKCLCIGAGIGIAALYPVIKALHDANNQVTTIISAKTSDCLILEDEINRYSDRLLMATDDGSKGSHGFVSDILENLVKKGESFELAVVIGSVRMMKSTTQRTVKAGIKTIVYLKPIMIDGTGMCGACRVTVGGEIKFACIDGPMFYTAEVDWDELTRRMSTYSSSEKKAMERHKCKSQSE